MEEEKVAEEEKEIIPPDYKCACLIPVEPMAEWVKGETEEDCRSCLLGPVVQWYRGSLEQHGHQDKAEELLKITEEPEVTSLTICQKLDSIKEAVEEPIRERLKDFDCNAQSFSEDDTQEQQAA